MAPPATISHTHHEPPNPSDNNDRPIPTTKTTSKNNNNSTYRVHGHGHHHAAGGGGSIYSNASFSSSSSIMPCANQGEEEVEEVAAVEGLVHSEARLEARLVTKIIAVFRLFLSLVVVAFYSTESPRVRCCCFAHPHLRKQLTPP